MLPSPPPPNTNVEYIQFPIPWVDRGPGIWVSGSIFTLSMATEAHPKAITQSRSPTLRCFVETSQSCRDPTRRQKLQRNPYMFLYDASPRTSAPQRGPSTEALVFMSQNSNIIIILYNRTTETIGSFVIVGVFGSAINHFTLPLAMAGRSMCECFVRLKDLHIRTRSVYYVALVLSFIKPRNHSNQHLAIGRVLVG